MLGALRNAHRNATTLTELLGGRAVRPQARPTRARQTMLQESLK
ncbi:MAG: hypothetical protein ABR586_11050 [Thermoplasmatota archaeon]